MKAGPFFCSGQEKPGRNPSAALARSPDPTARRLALAASYAQQLFACGHQFTATHERDRRLIRLFERAVRL